MRTIALAAALAAAATAEIRSFETAPLQCRGVQVVSSFEERGLQPRAFGINDRGLCSKYTFGGGWETPLNLYLGEDSSDHLVWISLAAGEWDEALGFQPGINVLPGARPKAFTVSDSAWRPGSQIPGNNVRDGQSVIYIKNGRGGPDDLAHGFCITRRSRSGDRLEEADIYIKAPGITGSRRMAIPQYAAFVDADHSVFSVVDDLYATILHEMGHAVGLKHIRSPGNLMSLLPSLAGSWDPVALRLHAETYMRISANARADPSLIPHVFRNDSMRVTRVPVTDAKTRNSSSVFSFALSPGPQDRTALMCIYEVD